MDIDTIIAIDPGANGGIAVQRGTMTQVLRIPKDVTGLESVLRPYAGGRTLAVLEKLQVRPDDVPVQGGKAAMGKMYRIQRMLSGYEQIKAVLDMTGMPYVMVHPASWQARMGLRVKGEEKSARKRRYRDVAAGLYPNVRVTLWNADALLMLRFGLWAVTSGRSWLKGNLPKKAHWLLEN